MKLNHKAIQNQQWWETRNILLPEYDLPEMRERTMRKPTWVHFGAGNLFRIYIAKIAQTLLNENQTDCGIIAVDTSQDGALKDQVYLKNDLLTLGVTLYADGEVRREVIGSVAEIIHKSEYERLKAIFCSDSLQMVSLTITEKGYTPEGIPGLLAKLLKERFQAGGAPVALVSMDNCSQNGEKLKKAVLAGADGEFLTYLQTKVRFPWTMIDKITPRPDARVAESLTELGLEDMGILPREKGAAIAPFVNAESAEYLVVEDDFPNGRPPLERAHVLLTNRETVNLTERMKVTACLNPLHTAMAVLGCMLGYTRIYEEMRDKDIVHLIRTIGEEGLRFVKDPKVLNPRTFLNELIENRLPNPYIPDAPQRIACDTSQKVPIRYGATISAWHEAGEEGNLNGVAIAVAGWIRYLLGLDDQLKPFEPSPDPRLHELQNTLKDVQIGKPVSMEMLKPILSDAAIFPFDLSVSPLGEKIVLLVNEMCAGAGAVRNTIQNHIKEASV